MPIPDHVRRALHRISEIGRNVTVWAVAVLALILMVCMITPPFGSQPPQFALSALVSHGATVCALAFSPDGRMLATADLDGTVRLWDRESGRERPPLRGRPGNTSVAFSPDGKVLAIARWGSCVQFWGADPAGERPALDVGATEGVRVAFSPDGSLLAVMHGSDGSVALWESAAGRRRAVLQGARRGLRDFAFAPDGRLLALAGGDGAVRLGETATGRQVGCIPAHRGPVTAVAFSPDGSLLASACDRDPAVRLWAVAEGRARATIHGPEGITGLAFSPSGALFVATETDGGIRCYDTGTGREQTAQRVESGGARVMAISPDGRQLATGGFDQKMQLWDITQQMDAWQTTPASGRNRSPNGGM